MYNIWYDNYVRCHVFPAIRPVHNKPFPAVSEFRDVVSEDVVFDKNKMSPYY